MFRKTAEDEDYCLSLGLYVVPGLNRDTHEAFCSRTKLSGLAFLVNHARQKMQVTPGMTDGAPQSFKSLSQRRQQIVLESNVTHDLHPPEQ
jgi:hypothetical protein